MALSRLGDTMDIRDIALASTQTSQFRALPGPWLASRTCLASLPVVALSSRLQANGQKGELKVRQLQFAIERG
jgi:hypothetical protein